MIKRLIGLADYLDNKGFKKEADFIDSLIKKFAQPIPNSMGFVDPQGKFHSTNGLSHPDWAHKNRHLVDFVGVKDKDYQSAEGEEATIDTNGSLAFDRFMDEGWIRVKPDNGVTVSRLDSSNLDMVKSILRTMAKTNHGRSLYIDDGNGALPVFVDMRGRPDFRVVDWEMKNKHD